jgi:hypothetical protein
MNVKVPNYLDRLQCLLVEPLHAARAAARDGTRVVGYVGNDVPVALIAAASALPVRLRCDARESTARADQFLESAHTPEMRSILEQWLAGELDFLAAVVFPRTDDSAQRLYYYLCELQRRSLCGGPRPLLYDVADIARPSSTGYTRESTRRLAQELGSREDLLASAMQRVARREVLLAEVRLRRAAESPLSGALAWSVERASTCDWREEFDAATRHWLLEGPGLSRARRILLAGDPPPDDSLHRAVENTGGTVVLELTESVAGAMPSQPALIDALADHFHARRNPVREMRANGDWVADRARHAQADAVVFWLIEEDEALPWEIARQMRSLVDARIPALLLARQPWRAGERTLNQVKEFVKTLKVAS